jgi:virulence-associated protein VagC
LSNDVHSRLQARQIDICEPMLAEPAEHVPDRMSLPIRLTCPSMREIQAVTIPKKNLLTTKRATVRRRRDRLITKPVKKGDTWDALWKALQPLNDSFRRWPTGPAEIRDTL